MPITSYFIRNYEDGKEDGEWLQYDKYNGQLLDKNNYKDGKIEGKQFTYYENGQIEYMINYKDGKRNGEALSYHENEYKTEIWKDDELIKLLNINYETLTHHMQFITYFSLLE